MRILQALFNHWTSHFFTDASRLKLDADVTLEEIKAAIHSFPSGKACGPDGFGIEFYR